MPLTVITLKKVPASLRGDLSKWMQEIDTGVYVGNFSTRIRERIWTRVLETCKDGDACMCFSSNNEIGYKICISDSNREVIDIDGIPLVRLLSKSRIKDSGNVRGKRGFSKAAKYRKARKYSNVKSEFHKRQFEYVSIDIETDGLDIVNDHIIEIGAYKEVNDVPFTYQSLVKTDRRLSKSITQLTGLSDGDLKNGQSLEKALIGLVDFIGSLPIVGYNVYFDLKFINRDLKKLSYGTLGNDVVDIMEFVKKDKQYVSGYKLNDVLKEYGIENMQPHRALEDAKSTYLLSKKLNEFVRTINQK